MESREIAWPLPHNLLCVCGEVYLALPYLQARVREEVAEMLGGARTLAQAKGGAFP